MWVKYFLSGFIVKIIAGFDDTMTRIPIIANLTKTKKGRIIFAFGIFLAILTAIAFSFFFGTIIKSIPYSNYISAGLILLLAFIIYFDIFVKRDNEVVRKEVKKIKPISLRKSIRLIAIGFITGFATILDDTLAYSALFLGTLNNSLFAISGILLATIIQIVIVVQFAKQFSKIKFRKEITVVGLIILSLLLFFKVL